MQRLQKEVNGDLFIVFLVVLVCNGRNFLPNEERSSSLIEDLKERARTVFEYYTSESENNEIR